MENRHSQRQEPRETSSLASNGLCIAWDNVCGLLTYTGYRGLTISQVLFAWKKTLECCCHGCGSLDQTTDGDSTANTRSSGDIKYVSCMQIATYTPSNRKTNRECDWPDVTAQRTTINHQSGNRGEHWPTSCSSRVASRETQKAEDLSSVFFVYLRLDSAESDVAYTFED